MILWNKIKTFTKWFLIVIGSISLLDFAYRFYKSEAEAKQYRNNCKLIKPGIIVSEAKKLMGDYDWYNKISPSNIWIVKDTTHHFYLSYPPESGASDQPRIYFDPNTLLVTKVDCY